MNWDEYLLMVQEVNSYRERVKPKRLAKDMNTYLSKGSSAAIEGSPLKSVKIDFAKKKFTDISAPPGALEEDTEADPEEEAAIEGED
jgi:hypothetical protein